MRLRLFAESCCFESAAMTLAHMSQFHVKDSLSLRQACFGLCLFEDLRVLQLLLVVKSVSRNEETLLLLECMHFFGTASWLGIGCEVGESKGCRGCCASSQKSFVWIIFCFVFSEMFRFIKIHAPHFQNGHCRIETHKGEKHLLH